MSALFGEVASVPQRGTLDIELRIYGDEFYARYETLDGYTVVEDEQSGLFSFATLRQGRFVSTGVPATSKPPTGLSLHLHEAPEKREEAFEKSYRNLRPESITREKFFTYGANRGLLSGRHLHSGDVLGLTILIDFEDEQTTITAAEVASLLNDDNYDTNQNAGSVRDYFRTMSGGVLNFRNEVQGPFKLATKKSFYEKAGKDLVADALEAARKGGVDFSRYASRPDRIVDSIIILYAGAKIFKGALWPASGSTTKTYDGVNTGFWLKTGLGSDAAGLRIGTLCHEAGHLLCRFPDLYDYGRRDRNFDPSSGIGRYCAMGNGEKLNDERTPAPICAYLRDLAGWCTNVVDLNLGGTFTAKQGDYTTVHRYRTTTDNEYFVIENRFRLGFDEHLPSSGLAIYQCDTKGSNEWEDGTPTKHYQVLLLQADGRKDLQKKENSGDGGDLFGAVAGVALSETTTPNSKMWSGADSGLRVSDISASAAEISFTIAAPG